MRIMNKRLIAIHLPQFHPFKENNEWWGKGFTEWSNVVKGYPRFRGQYQPHIPTDTGFYDLRLPEARQMQADMARESGIYGFCYYHYWFNGHRLMERPVNEILSSGKPDFPFMLCWANENWARNWDGGFKKLLMEQHYCAEDDIRHMEYLCKNVFSDSRYIRVNGKPFFVVYKPTEFPNMKETIERWRTIATKYGMDLYLTFMKRRGVDCEYYIAQGFDAAIEFQPTAYLSEYNKYKHLIPRLLSRLVGKRASTIEDYKKYMDYSLSQPSPSFKLYPGIFPSWDNSARRLSQNFMAFKNSSPSLYGQWLKKIVEKYMPFSEDENFIFVNAWNEWAEGNHLEPDTKWGRAYLEETKRVMLDSNL